MTSETAIIGPVREVQDKGAEVIPLPITEQVREFIRASKAENTLRGYQSDWRDFCAWCEAHSVSPLPASAETVAAYIAECAGRLKVGSIQRRLNAIAEAHKAVGVESPTHAPIVANTMKGIRRSLGTAPAQKTPTLTDDVRAMLDAADVEDCAFGNDGLTVTLRRSKTDQSGAGRKVGIPYGANPDTCPVRTVQAWL